MSIEAFLAQKIWKLISIMVFFGSFSVLLHSTHELIYLVPMVVSGYIITK